MCVDSRVLGTGNGMDWGLGHWSEREDMGGAEVD